MVPQSQPVSCLNCGHTFTGNYCNHCGQKANTHRFSVGHVAHELPHQLFHLDKGIFRNIRSILRPRKAVQEFLAGKRVSYFNPLLFFFLTLGAILYLEQALGKQAMIMMDIEMDIGPLGTQQYDAGPFLNKYQRYLYFALAFLAAVPNYFLFRKETGYNYAEQVLAATFVLGFANLAYLAMLWSPWVDGYPSSPFFFAMFLLFTAVIFYRGKWWLSAVKAIASLAATSSLFILALLLLWGIRLKVYQVFGI